MKTIDVLIFRNHRSIDEPGSSLISGTSIRQLVGSIISGAIVFYLFTEFGMFDENLTIFLMALVGLFGLVNLKLKFTTGTLDTILLSTARMIFNKSSDKNLKKRKIQKNKSKYLGFGKRFQITQTIHDDDKIILMKKTTSDVLRILRLTAKDKKGKLCTNQIVVCNLDGNFYESSKTDSSGEYAIKLNNSIAGKRILTVFDESKILIHQKILLIE